MVKRMQGQSAPLTRPYSRRTLSSMVVACASGARIPAGSTSILKNDLCVKTVAVSSTRASTRRRTPNSGGQPRN